jgi:NAD-dependent SIR2 family protein deacetylase
MPKGVYEHAKCTNCGRNTKFKESHEPSYGYPLCIKCDKKMRAKNGN